jgi:hypothetical protein
MPNVLVTFALALSLLAPAVAVAQTTRPAVAIPADPLATLRPGHPRLLALDDRLARVRQLIASDSQAQAYWRHVVGDSDKLLTAPVSERKLIGPRLLSVSREVLNRVQLLGARYRLEPDRAAAKKYADRAIRELLAVAQFQDWNPSHFLDVAEMTAAFATGYDWLFDAMTPDQRAAVRGAIVAKGLEPGLDAVAKKAWWVTTTNNWNQVCWGGLTLGALAIADEEPDLAKQILRHALTNLPTAMATFGPDGGCIEGPGYWQYATRYTSFMLVGCETALGTSFGLDRIAGLSVTGDYRMQMTGPTLKQFNFADAGEGATPSSAMFDLARRYNRPDYAAAEVALFPRWGDAFHLLWYEPAPAEAAARLPLDARFRGIEVAMFRSSAGADALYVAFKAGDNAASHAHLDLGTFVIDASGQRFASELGGDDYNLPGYFGKERWTYYRLKTEGQNTLVFGNDNQPVKAAGVITDYVSTPAFACAVADLTAAGGRNATSWRRGVGMVDRKAVVVQDEFDTPGPVDVMWCLQTAAQVEIGDAGRTATLTAGGKALVARIESPEGAAFGVEPAPIAPPQKPWKDGRRLSIKLAGSAGPRRITVVFAAPDAGGQIPLRSLADWAKTAR